MRAGGTICEQDEASRCDQPMSVNAIYPTLLMMLTMAMPAMKRSALDHGIGPPCGCPAQWYRKKFGWIRLWVSEDSRTGSEGQRFYVTVIFLAARPGIANPGKSGSEGSLGTDRDQIPRIFPVSPRWVARSFRLGTSRTGL
jgi:hypothetical protein